MAENINNKIHPRDQILLMMQKIYAKGLTTTSGGNLSIIEDNGDLWVTPSGIDKGTLKPEDIMCVKANGEIVGPHKPSMEYPFHKAIYEARPDVKAIVHAHPPALVAFSISHQIPNTGVSQQVHQVCGTIAYANYHAPGSDALGDELSEAFKKGCDSVIMENHGAVFSGSDIDKAYERFETLEYACRTIIHSKVIGNAQFLKGSQITQYNSQEPVSFPSFKHEETSTKEHHLRTQVIDLLKRAEDQHLMTSAYGTISVRVNKNDFLITPTGQARCKIENDDLVYVKGEAVEQGKRPSRSCLLHQKIYHQNPEIHAIIITKPEYIMAFALTHRKLDVRSIPESWIFLQDMENLPFESIFVEDSQIVEKISTQQPGVIVENDSVMMTGNTLIQAYDRLEVAEFTAKSLVMASSIGSFEPMGDDKIEELRKKFF